MALCKQCLLPNDDNLIDFGNPVSSVKGWKQGQWQEVWVKSQFCWSIAEYVNFRCHQEYDIDDSNDSDTSDSNND